MQQNDVSRRPCASGDDVEKCANARTYRAHGTTACRWQHAARDIALTDIPRARHPCEGRGLSHAEAERGAAKQAYAR